MEIKESQIRRLLVVLKRLQRNHKEKSDKLYQKSLIVEGLKNEEFKKVSEKSNKVRQEVFEAWLKADYDILLRVIKSIDSYNADPVIKLLKTNSELSEIVKSFLIKSHQHLLKVELWNLSSNVIAKVLNMPIYSDYTDSQKLLVEYHKLYDSYCHHRCISIVNFTIKDDNYGCIHPEKLYDKNEFNVEILEYKDSAVKVENQKEIHLGFFIKKGLKTFKDEYKMDSLFIFSFTILHNKFLCVVLKNELVFFNLFHVSFCCRQIGTKQVSIVVYKDKLYLYNDQKYAVIDPIANLSNFF